MSIIDPFRLYQLVSDSLLELYRLKVLVVRLHQYEWAAKLRNVEKQLLEIQQFTVSIHRFLHGTAHQPAFNYARALQWRDLPEPLVAILEERKRMLNSTWKFEQAHLDFIERLDERLCKETLQVLNFMAEPATGLNRLIGLVRLECFKNADDTEVPFYCLYLPIGELRHPPFKEEPDSIASLSADLPIALLNKPFGVLAASLLVDGLLALEDLLRINAVRLKLPVYYLSATVVV